MGNMINLDITLFIQLANFLIAIVVLNYLIIKPVRDQISARNALTTDYTAEIDRFTAEAAGKLSSYESSLSQARTEASVAREAVRAQGHTKEQELIQAAQSDAQAFLQSSRVQAAEESKAAMTTLLSQVNAFAAKAVSKILG